jgi:tight adherence protein B
MGGDLEKIITRTTEILTDKINIDREIKTITSQKKMEGRIIALMPLVMLLALNIVSYTYISPLYETTIGRMIMTGAMGATGYGIYLMEKIADIHI